MVNTRTALSLALLSHGAVVYSGAMEEKIEVASVGVGYFEPPGFKVDRPRGAGEYVFLHLLSPAKVGRAGSAVRLEPGACILFGPASSQFYHGDGVPLANDWFHMRGSGLPGLLERRGIPLDTPFRPYQTGFIGPLLRAMHGEITLRQAGWEEVSALQLRQFFLYLSRHLCPPPGLAGSPRKLAVLPRFQQLRLRMAHAPAEDWPVSRMAAEVHFSRSRFTALYAEFFGVTPTEDVIAHRLRLAESLLTNTTASVGDIARACGFHSAYYFSRLFHKRIGCAPRDYGAGRPAGAEGAEEGVE